MKLHMFVLFLLLAFPNWSFSRTKRSKNIGQSDGLVHVAFFGHYSPGGKFSFPNYTEGNTTTNLITQTDA